MVGCDAALKNAARCFGWALFGCNCFKPEGTENVSYVIALGYNTLDLPGLKQIAVGAFLPGPLPPEENESNEY